MGFWAGAWEGFSGAAVGLWEGGKALVQGGYALATDPEAREQAWEATKGAANAVGDYASAVYDDPEKLWTDVRDGTLAAYSAAEEFVQTADAEDWGELIGAGVFEVGTALIPVTKVTKLGTAAKLADNAADAARVIDKTEDVVDRVEDAVDASKGLPNAEPKCLAGCPRRVVPRSYKGNEAKWTVDSEGRPVSAEVHLTTDNAGVGRSAVEKQDQLDVGHSGLETDEGGHLIGHRFMGDQGTKNLIPQDANLNRSAYKKMENEWADWLDEGKEIQARIDLSPPGADRPDAINVYYDVFDPDTGEVVYTNNHKFLNKSDEPFDRVPRSEMGTASEDF